MPDAPKTVTEEAGVLERNAVDSLPRGALAAKLQSAREEGRPLRVKLGIDPTAPDIHLGHAVVLGKLREFQDAGHRVVLIVGDYTARVGDPSGRSSMRPMLSGEEIDENAATFQGQALKILNPDKDRLEVRRNSEWLDMALTELLGLVRTTTVAQLLERDDFAKRFSAKQPISMLELLYPLLQGYDSVAIDADVELGGTDQKFNLLLGRDIQRAYGKAEQAILTMPILVGTDGQKKMSKSLGNQIGVTDEPEEMYGKTLSIPDGAMEDYYRLLLGREREPRDGESREDGVERAGAPTALSPRDGGAEGHVEPTAFSPRDEKRALARALVTRMYSTEQAEQAEQAFDRVFVQHAAPEEIEDARFQTGTDGLVHLPGVIGEAFGISRSEGRRLIDQGGVTLGGSVLGKGEHDVPAARAEGEVLKVGKRRFCRLRAG